MYGCRRAALWLQACSEARPVGVQRQRQQQRSMVQSSTTDAVASSR